MGHLGIAALTVDKLAASVDVELLCLPAFVIIRGFHPVVACGSFHGFAVNVEISCINEFSVLVVFPGDSGITGRKKYRLSFYIHIYFLCALVVCIVGILHTGTAFGSVCRLSICVVISLGQLVSVLVVGILHLGVTGGFLQHRIFGRIQERLTGHFLVFIVCAHPAAESIGTGCFCTVFIKIGLYQDIARIIISTSQRGIAFGKSKGSLDESLFRILLVLRIRILTLCLIFCSRRSTCKIGFLHDVLGVIIFSAD